MIFFFCVSYESPPPTPHVPQVNKLTLKPLKLWPVAPTPQGEDVEKDIFFTTVVFSSANNVCGLRMEKIT